ncbi:WD40 repeat-like protein [Thelephora ganbajun]|uniref:WD40 repeat-like protein n=1 Tax=Thelephora ganbajun TaxID=370292 RepID=A0ACB6ZAT7_THEGA|nr:WD40 repeat-like protein [Thelephora ganbajun]
MSTKPTPKQLKSILKAEIKATKRVRVSEDAHVKADPAPKLSSKSKGKQRETVASVKTPSNPKLKKDQSQPKANSSSSRPPSAFKLVTGSYEKLLYGLEGSITLGEGDGDRISVNLKPIFIFPAHVSCVKAVSGSPMGGKWLATGSVDEIVKVWDLRRRKEVGGLMQHEGSITELHFPSRSHLISASEDGTMAIFHARDWVVLRVLKGHKGRINSVGIHPSGKVALSVGADKTLRMWDLMRGKGSASTKLGKGACEGLCYVHYRIHASFVEGEKVRWSTNGKLFVVQSRSNLEFFDTNLALLHTITHPSRIQDVKFVQHPETKDEILLVGAEDKKLSVYVVPSETSEAPYVIAEMIGHTNRVKAVDTIEVSLPNQSTTTVVATISSDGKARVYDLAQVPKPVPGSGVGTIGPVGEYDSNGSRLVCLALVDSDGAEEEGSVVGKRKRDENEEEDGPEVLGEELGVQEKELRSGEGGSD